MLKWKEEYSVGIDSIDLQHKKLFKIGNDAYKLLKNDFCIDKYDEIVDIIEELRRYTKYHFNLEEEYMLKNKCKRYFNQKKEHDAFIEKIYSADLKKIDTNQDEYINNLLKFVFEWIINHMLKEDKRIQNECNVD
ncbi:hemerythrin family protein [Clostridium oceanicum]|uniref:Bacteriohemerythrin n=1 Tax=Clostridium oceanicum TaxID=1543 RepID=A0ABN1JEG4_9CLOT